MGRDKALLEIEGRPLIAIATEKLSAAGASPRICGSRPDLARFAEVIPDNFARCGPLGGIEAALAVSDSDLNLFLPVDLPGLPVDFLHWMAERAEATEAVATIPRYGGRPEPLCAVYSRRMLPGVREALGSGQYKMMAALGRAAAALGERIDSFDVETIAAALIPAAWPAAPRPEEWFRNINTPADYAGLHVGN
jgi:molybdenum cofactor guanylyltransferase